MNYVFGWLFVLLACAVTFVMILTSPLWLTMDWIIWEIKKVLYNSNKGP